MPVQKPQTPRHIYDKVKEAKRLKIVSQKSSDLIEAAQAHKKAAELRSQINQWYLENHDRKRTKPKGYVYFLENQSFDYIKVGFTTRAIPDRMQELNRSTSLPTEFKLVGYIVCEDAAKLEKKIHNFLSKWRININREFFKLSFNEAADIIEKKLGRYPRIRR